MKKQLIYSLLIASLAGTVGCRSVKLQIADEAYSCLAYAKAIKEYTAALKWKEDHRARINLAHSYMQMNDPVNAEKNYRKAIEHPDTEPAHWLNFARVLMENEKHEEAMAWLKAYMEKQPGSKIANTLYESCTDITALKKSKDAYDVKKIEISAVSFAYAAVPQGNGIVFTGDELSPDAKKDPWTGCSFVNLYYMERDGSGWHTPTALKGAINGTFHEGAASFGNAGSTICFTRSNYHHKKNKLAKNKKDISNLKIFFATKNGDSWENLVEFPFNSDDYSAGQPCLSNDGTTLFFISDMPGGYGGTDIYVSHLNAITTLDGSAWSKPRNLGPVINTPGNEMFPWFDKEGNALYFASDAHPSLGGLDIFVANLKGNDWSEPRNLGEPINTSKDDFALVMNANGKSGYFSSSRDNIDQVYEFKIPEPVFSLTGVIMDRKRGTPLSNATINLIDARDNKKITVRTDESGKYLVKLDRNASYKLDAAAENYFAAFGEASTVSKERSEVLKADFTLDEMETDKAIVLENILYDLNKWNIRADAARELSKLAGILKQNPNIKIELGSHTDARGNDKANMELSEKRAQACVDYLASQGIARERLTAKGYGETMPVNKCTNGIKCTEWMHQQNRRTELKILKADKIASIR